MWQWDQELYDGSSTTFEVLSRRDTVLVLPLTGNSEVLLAREVQPGVAERLHSFGGRIEAGEDPSAAAQRELSEELGVHAERLALWAAWQPLSKIDWAVYLFWAGGLTNSADSEPDPGERIAVETVPLNAVLSFSIADRLNDAELLYRLGLAAMSEHESSRMRSSLSAALEAGDQQDAG